MLKKFCFALACVLCVLLSVVHPAQASTWVHTEEGSKITFTVGQPVRCDGNYLYFSNGTADAASFYGGKYKGMVGYVGPIGLGLTVTYPPTTTGGTYYMHIKNIKITAKNGKVMTFPGPIAFPIGSGTHWQTTTELAEKYLEWPDLASNQVIAFHADTALQKVPEEQSNNYPTTSVTGDDYYYYYDDSDWDDWSDLQEGLSFGEDLYNAGNSLEEAAAASGCDAAGFGVFALALALAVPFVFRGKRNR